MMRTRKRYNASEHNIMGRSGCRGECNAEKNEKEDFFFAAFRRYLIRRDVVIKIFTSVARWYFAEESFRLSYIVWGYRGRKVFKLRFEWCSTRVPVKNFWKENEKSIWFVNRNSVLESNDNNSIQTSSALCRIAEIFYSQLLILAFSAIVSVIQQNVITSGVSRLTSRGKRIIRRKKKH